MNSDTLGVIRRTEEGIEVEPLEGEGAALIQEVKEREGKKRVTIKSAVPEGCSMEPDVPAELALCATLQDLRAARMGKMDLTLLLKRLATREVLRQSYKREGLTAKVSDEIRKLREGETP